MDILGVLVPSRFQARPLRPHIDAAIGRESVLMVAPVTTTPEVVVIPAVLASDKATPSTVVTAGLGADGGGVRCGEPLARDGAELSSPK